MTPAVTAAAPVGAPAVEVPQKATPDVVRHDVETAVEAAVEAAAEPDELVVPPHPAGVEWVNTAALIQAMTVHFALRATAEQDPALGLVAVILDEAPCGVAAKVAAILCDVEEAKVDPLGVVERIALDAIIADYALARDGGDRR